MIQAKNHIFLIDQSDFKIKFYKDEIYFAYKSISCKKDFFIILGFIDYLKYIFYSSFRLKRVIKKYETDKNDITNTKPLDFILNKN